VAKQRELDAMAAVADRFAEILALRTPRITEHDPEKGEGPGTKLLNEFGGTRLQQWWQMAIARFNKHRLEAVLQASTGGQGKAPAPGSAHRRSSRSTS